MFDIKSADEVGVFEVSAKFMGVAMEKVELVFQVRYYPIKQYGYVLNNIVPTLRKQLRNDLYENCCLFSPSFFSRFSLIKC